MLTVQVKMNTEQKENIETLLEQVKKHISLGYNKGTGSNGTEGYSFSITEKTAPVKRTRKKKVVTPELTGVVSN